MTDDRIRELEFVLSELKREFENFMTDRQTHANPRPWEKSEAWQRAEKLIHIDDVPREQK